MFVIESAARIATIIFFNMRRCYLIIALFLTCLGASAQAPGGKPIVIFYRTVNCPRCDKFECETVRHPIIQRRLPRVDFRIQFVPGRPSVAWFDANGELRQEWPIVPDVMNLEVMLDSA